MSKRIDANSLAMENIRQRKTRSTCMILLVALFSIIVYMGSMFSLSLSRGLESLSDRLGADVIVVPAGYKAEIESVLLKGEPSTFYLPADTIDKLKKFDEIEKMTPQIYVATLSASCCSYPVQIIGIDIDTDFLIYPWITHNIDKELKDGEAIVGSHVVGEKGETVHFFNEELKIWEERKTNFYNEREKFNASINELNDRYNKNEKEAVEEYFELVLDTIEFPYEGLEGNYDLEYNELSKILVLDYVLPNIDVIPDLKNMTYVKSRDEFNETYITEKQKEKVYNELLYGLVLKIVEVLYSKVENDSVKSIVFNGWIENINKATGNEQSFCLLSLQTKKEDFEVINLEQVDYKTCFRKLKGISKPNLNDLVPVAPILNINTEDKRFIDNVEIGDKIEGINIANIDWKDFEHLIRELFQKEFENDGVEVKTTQASRDGGVDAIMFDPDPIKGGKYIIQAKRYNNLVGISAVRDLYGAVHNEGATKGILVTTSDFGADSYEFVKDKPLTLINGSNLLSLLQKHNYKNVRIDLKEGK